MEDEFEGLELGESEGGGYSELLDVIKEKMDTENNYVILVDDEAGIRKKVARDIKSFAPGIQICEAGNGIHAIEVLNKARAKLAKDPLFMVVDLNMPVMDGWTFIN